MIQVNGSQPTVLVLNNYDCPLTAYELRISFDKSVTEQRIDARIDLRASPILPGESRSFPLVARRTSLSGPRVDVTAALFADGTSAGDATPVAELKGVRDGFHSQLGTIEAKFHELKGQHVEIPTVMATLESMRGVFALTTVDHAQSIGGARAYVLVTSALKDFQVNKPDASADEAITAVLKTIEGRLAALQTDSSLTIPSRCAGADPRF
jgi:hypothetical protein